MEVEKLGYQFTWSFYHRVALQKLWDYVSYVRVTWGEGRVDVAGAEGSLERDVYSLWYHHTIPIHSQLPT